MQVKGEEFKFELDESSGALNQTVNAGETLSDFIVIDCNAITAWEVSGLPNGLRVFIDDDDHPHTIMIGSTVNDNVASGDYKYTVTVKDNNSQEHSLSGVITVIGIEDDTEIKVTENEKQKVTAGDDIKPIVLKFQYVTVTENLENFKIETTLPASLNIGVENDVMTINGTVNEETLDGIFSIKIIARGEKNSDTASEMPFFFLNRKHYRHFLTFYALNTLSLCSR